MGGRFLTHTHTHTYTHSIHDDINIYYHARQSVLLGS